MVCTGSVREVNKLTDAGLQKERVEMAEAILTNRNRINIVVTTYDMAQKKEDNKFMRHLKPDVSLLDFSSPLSLP